MSELEIAMGMIIDVFARYSGQEGNKQTLTKGELKVLMEKELPGFLQVGCRAPGDRVGGPPGSRPAWSGNTEGQAGLGREGLGRQRDRRSRPSCSKGEGKGAGREAVTGGRVLDLLPQGRGSGTSEQGGDVARSVLETELEPQCVLPLQGVRWEPEWWWWGVHSDQIQSHL